MDDCYVKLEPCRLGVPSGYIEVSSSGRKSARQIPFFIAHSCKPIFLSPPLKGPINLMVHYYAVKAGRAPGIYKTWFVRYFLRTGRFLTCTIIPGRRPRLKSQATVVQNTVASQL